MRVHDFRETPSREYSVFPWLALGDRLFVLVVVIDRDTCGSGPCPYATLLYGTGRSGTELLGSLPHSDSYPLIYVPGLTTLPSPPLHLWTTDQNEYSVLSGRGWIPEGPAGHVLR